MLWTIIWIILMITIICHILSDKFSSILMKLWFFLLMTSGSFCVAVIPLLTSTEFFNYEIPKPEVTTNVTEVMYPKRVQICYFDENGEEYSIGNRVTIVHDTTSFIIKREYDTEKDVLYYIFGYVPWFDAHTLIKYEIHTQMEIGKE